MSNYIVDDRLNDHMLRLDIAKMTDEEFEKFEADVKEKGKYPDKYYLE